MRVLTKSMLFGTMAVVAASTTVQAKPVWREAFQSSPASYEQPSDEFVKAIAERMKVPADSIRAGLMAQPVSGTVRYRITIEGAGAQVRIRLSNEEGKAALRVA